mgnify:CR=1 FL=1
MDHAVPVWVWLPGRSVPVQAGELVHEPPAGFRYLPEYLSQQRAVALDPNALVAYLMQVHAMARPVATTHLSLWFGGFAVGWAAEHDGLQALGQHAIFDHAPIGQVAPHAGILRQQRRQGWVFTQPLA